jgi:glucan phosphoethanolaminetransferase (alkaline phosphatase superfamily)
VTKSFKLICDCLKWLSKEGFHFYWTLHIKVAAWHFRALKDCCLDALVVDEFFFSGSFLSFEAHHKTQGVSQGVAQASLANIYFYSTFIILNFYLIFFHSFIFSILLFIDCCEIYLHLNIYSNVVFSSTKMIANGLSTGSNKNVEVLTCSL